jgi:hypothetical protein
VPTCQDLAGFWDMVHIQVYIRTSFYVVCTCVRQCCGSGFASIRIFFCRDPDPAEREVLEPAPDWGLDKSSK